MPERFISPTQRAENAGLDVNAKFRNRAKRGAHYLDEDAPPPVTVVFVVLGGVRADHTSVCGYDRPTTPALQRLADRDASTFTCGLTPSATTPRPAVASMMSGRALWDHQVLGPKDAFQSDDSVVAARFAAEGVRSVLVSAEGGVGALGTGFHTVFAPFEGRWSGQQLAASVSKALVHTPKRQGLFISVLVSDARPPFPAVSAELGWGPQQEALDLDAHLADPNGPLGARRGKVEPADRVQARRQVVAAYDAGVRAADDTLGLVLAAVKRSGRTSDLRVVVVADHGFALGEHGQFGTAGLPYEELTRLPLVWFDSEGEAPDALPDRVSAREVAELLASGTAPDGATPVQSVAMGDGGKGGVAQWEGTTKWVALGQRVHRVELTTDPNENQGVEASQASQAVELERARQALRAMKRGR